MVDTMQEELWWASDFAGDGLPFCTATMRVPGEALPLAAAVPPHVCHCYMPPVSSTM